MLPNLRRASDLNGWFGTWIARNLCASGALQKIASELGKYTLNLLGIQDKGGTELAQYRRTWGEGVREWGAKGKIFA
jgi:hypothetical protein